MSAEVEWFMRVWCKPQGHRHADTITEIGCMARVLGALRGEEPSLREAFVAAVIQAERIHPDRFEGGVARDSVRLQP